MDVAQDLKKRLKAVVWPLVFACIAIYFGVHLIRNDHGLLALRAYDQRLEEAQAELARLTDVRTTLERETRALTPARMHPDALGEHARRRLNMGLPDEVVILHR